MKFKALGYQGVYWLKDLGTYNSREEAFAALEKYIETSIAEATVDESMDSEDVTAHEERLWYDSRIEEAP